VVENANARGTLTRAKALDNGREAQVRVQRLNPTWDQGNDPRRLHGMEFLHALQNVPVIIWVAALLLALGGVTWLVVRKVVGIKKKTRRLSESLQALHKSSRFPDEGHEDGGEEHPPIPPPRTKHDTERGPSGEEEQGDLLGDLTQEWRVPKQEALGSEGPGEAQPEPVQFTVYHPQQVVPGRWYDLLAYVHIPQVHATVDRDSAKRLDESEAYGRRRASATQGIRRGAEILVVPELPGCRFNPGEQRLLWVEDWHRVEFRVSADPGQPGFELGKAVNGRVAFYVETVLVGEVPIWALVSERAEIGRREGGLAPATGTPYRSVFVSYSHRDSAIVERLGKAYEALGMTFLRDIAVLRSGEKWNAALLDLIEQADIFQLYWSAAASASPYVEQEWHHALEQHRAHFIRPVYWEEPMPPPPADLADIHFRHLTP
jgi:TIR domain